MSFDAFLPKDKFNPIKNRFKRLNEQVKRNLNRFPDTFRFQLSENEFDEFKLQTTIIVQGDQNLKSQYATSSEHGGQIYDAYVFFALYLNNISKNNYVNT